MLKVHHINCGTLRVPGYPTVVCHCLLLEAEEGLVLVDTGIGLEDVRDPAGRLGQELVDGAGFQFHEDDTAIRRIEALGFSPNEVRHIVLTHADPDHTGGLADFPHAQVHIAEEEFQALQAGTNPRYVPSHFSHGPNWQTYGFGTVIDWFGLKVRQVELNIPSAPADVFLLPLFGHTVGHCGVAIWQDGTWLLHAGDAYYLRAELTQEDHPVNALARARAAHDRWRLNGLTQLRRIFADHSDEVSMIGYHDITELPDHPDITPDAGYVPVG